MATQADADAAKLAANTKKTSLTNYLPNIAAFSSGMADYKQACEHRRDAVQSLLNTTELSSVNSYLTSLSDSLAPAIQPYNDAIAKKDSGNSKLGQAETSYGMGQWAMCVSQADAAKSDYEAGIAKGNQSVTTLDQGRSAGIAANAVINAKNLAHPTPDPGDPNAPEVPSSP